VEKKNSSSSGLNRRNPFDVWAELMEACLWTSRTQSWLLRQLRLNTAAIKEAIEYLVKSELIAEIISEEIENRQYKTTLKGKKALQSYYDLITNYFGRSKPVKREE
jgi:predicted transcriptional regulator